MVPLVSINGYSNESKPLIVEDPDMGLCSWPWDTGLDPWHLATAEFLAGSCKSVCVGLAIMHVRPKPLGHVQFTWQAITIKSSWDDSGLAEYLTAQQQEDSALRIGCLGPFCVEEAGSGHCALSDMHPTSARSTMGMAAFHTHKAMSVHSHKCWCMPVCIEGTARSQLAAHAAGNGPPTGPLY